MTTLTIIGSAGSHASAERVCSSYLISHDGYNLVLDLGPGALHNLSKVIDVADLDAILISHLHPDHYLDLYGLQYALRFHPDQPGPVRVYGPAGMREKIAAILPDESMQKMGDLLHFHTVAAGQNVPMKKLDIQLFGMNHPVECLGSRTIAGNHVIAFTGDTAPTPAISQLADNADLFLCDATWSESRRPLPPDTHSTGLEAGRAAADAKVGHLILTHVSPYTDPAAVADEAATVFDGDITVATDLMEFHL